MLPLPDHWHAGAAVLLLLLLLSGTAEHAGCISTARL
jgi:hypothetical protein